jgi:hypothetical protein
MLEVLRWDDEDAIAHDPLRNRIIISAHIFGFEHYFISRFFLLISLIGYVEFF